MAKPIGFVGGLRHNLHPAAPATLLVHDHLPVDAVLQGGDMGDDAHQPVALGQAGEHPDGLLQRFLIQRAEALIEEEGVQPDAACGALDFIRKTQGQRQRGLEALAAGEGLDIAAGAVVVVDDAKVQPGLAWTRMRSR